MAISTASTARQEHRLNADTQRAYSRIPHDIKIELKAISRIWLRTRVLLDEVIGTVESGHRLPGQVRAQNAGPGAETDERRNTKEGNNISVRARISLSATENGASSRAVR